MDGYAVSLAENVKQRSWYSKCLVELAFPRKETLILARLDGFFKFLYKHFNAKRDSFSFDELIVLDRLSKLVIVVSVLQLHLWDYVSAIHFKPTIMVENRPAIEHMRVSKYTFSAWVANVYTVSIV